MAYYKTDYGSVIETDYPSESYVRITKKEYERLDRANAIAQLKKMLKPGKRVYTRVDHVSQSGMSREITVLCAYKNDVRNISYLVAKVLGRKLGNNNGVKIGGCGMDMGFAIVYQLGATLWPNGTRKPHGRRNGEPDHAGGYVLNQVWI